MRLAPQAAALFALLAAVPAQAMLSGYWDSGRQIGTILADARIADALRQAPIVSITAVGRTTDTVEWSVKTDACELRVRLRVILPPGPGRTDYRVEPPDACH